MSSILDKISTPKDLQSLQHYEVEKLCSEIREFLIENVSRTGGHLASNLGVVELTLALHTVFDTSQDKLIFDVGHQSYVHKLLTGRRGQFHTLRQWEGLSGFPKRNESLHDCFDTGHSSTSISAAVGMALARDLKGEEHSITALIGDGALTGGLALEALNHLGSCKTDVLVVLNDNEMSIDRNVGGLSEYFSNIRMSSAYRQVSRQVTELMESMPLIGGKASKAANKVKDSIKQILVPGMWFEQMGIKYYGPVDGHNYPDLVRALEELKNIPGPKILHVLTVKGKGYRYAEENPSSYHGVSPFTIQNGVHPSSSMNYSKMAGETLKEIFAEDPLAVAVTAAMPSGTGLDVLGENFPNRLIDVGIAEGHAVTLCAGMAAGGVRPYFAVYSTFLQRGYDQIVHDVCLQHLPVTFLIDRAGLVGEDGETHHGILDLSYLLPIPNLTLLAPKSTQELSVMIRQMHSFKGPVAIRYPRGTDEIIWPKPDLEESVLQWESLRAGKDCALLCVGKMAASGLCAAMTLEKEGLDCAVWNCRVLKPFDAESLQKIMDRHRYVFVLEDNFTAGGFSSYLTSHVQRAGYTGRITSIGFPENFVAQGNTQQLFHQYQMDCEGITQTIRQTLKIRSLAEKLHEKKA